MSGRILITGGTGFLGSRLTKKLASMDYDVHLLVRPTSRHEEVADCVRDDHFHVVDEKQSTLNAVMQSVRPTHVIHLAALWRVPHGTNATEALVRSNVLFPAMLLEAMDAAGVRNLINAGSIWQYYENRSYSPVDLYAATKQAFETIAQYYAEARSFNVLHLVIGDTYGENDSRPKLIPTLLKSKSPIDLSPGEQRVEFLHVDDVVSGFCSGIAYIQNQKSPVERYSLRPEKAIRLKDLVALLEEIMGRKNSVNWGGRPYREREMMQPMDLWPTLPGWSAKIHLKDGLKRLCADRELNERG